MLDLAVSQKFITAGALALVWALESEFPFVPARQHRYQHAARNLFLGLLNSLLMALLMTTFVVGIGDWVATQKIGLLHFFALPAWTKFALAILLLDAWMYVWHRANHEVPFLWRFHRVHHSDVNMDVTTAVRFHAGEIVISGLLRLTLIPLLGLSLQQILFYDMLLLPVIFLHHSNINLPEKIDRVLRAIIATPALHRVHHSRIQIETDSNYSSIFSWWDRMAKTFRPRKDVTKIHFGVDGFDSASQQSLMGMLQMPFTNSVSAKANLSPVLPATAKQPTPR